MSPAQLLTPRQSLDLSFEGSIMSLSDSDTHSHLAPRFAKIKQSLITRKEDAVVASWRRLLDRIGSEIDHIKKLGPDIFPSIDLQDVRNDSRAREFSASLRKCGAGVIRGVIAKDVINGWVGETEQYLSHNSAAEEFPAQRCHVHETYWSPAQVKARTCPNVLIAQAFLMKLWQTSDPETPLTTHFPVAYADRLDTGDSEDFFNTFVQNQSAYMDGGSVERWEPDGYGVDATYQKIWSGNWEDYNPWDSSTRLKIGSNLYNSGSACSVFRMFNGWLCLSERPPSESPLRLCPMLQLSTAYVLLRPFFAPINPSTTYPGFLSPDNWILETPHSPILQGAALSFRQELNDSLHPHLRLSESMVPAPELKPGDYLIWHCDSVISPRSGHGAASYAAGMHLPTCPLTETNALYLARQRKAFLLGHPGPDFDDGGQNEGSYMGRPGVQEVSDVGGEDGLRAMGLLPWDEDDVKTGVEAEVLEMANNILFPDRHDFDMVY